MTFAHYVFMGALVFTLSLYMKGLGALRFDDAAQTDARAVIVRGWAIFHAHMEDLAPYAALLLVLAWPLTIVAAFAVWAHERSGRS